MQVPPGRRNLGRITLSAAVALAAALGLAAPALAHPFIVGGGRVPVQSLATIELDLAHGCGVERAGTGPDTDEVALDVPRWLRVVDVPVPDGWTVTVEDALVVWSAAGASEPAPRLGLDVVVDGEVGETRYLRVSQRCGDLVERWIGTPDAPAEQPAVRLVLGPADPARPAPPLPQPEPEPDAVQAPEPEPEPQPQPQPQPEPQPDAVPAPAPAGEPDGTIAGRTAAVAVAVATVGAALALGAALRAGLRRTRGGGGRRPR